MKWKAKIFRPSREFSLERKLDAYIKEYVPVKLELPKRKLATSSEYFEAPKQKGFWK